MQNSNYMTKESVLSNTIKWFRFPMTLAIIPAHANLVRYGLLIHGEQYGMNYPDWYFYMGVFLSEIMGSISVPLFFVISGYSINQISMARYIRGN